MKFAYLIMGSFQSESDRAVLQNGMVQIIGVADIQDATAVARKLWKDGVGCIELCGAFGADGAKKIIEATQNQIPVGYVTHLPKQEAVYQAAFPDDLSRRMAIDKNN